MYSANTKGQTKIYFAISVRFITKITYDICSMEIASIVWILMKVCITMSHGRVCEHMRGTHDYAESSHVHNIKIKSFGLKIEELNARNVQVSSFF